MEIFRDFRPELIENKKINFKHFSEVASEEVDKCVAWENDPDIQAMIFPRRKESVEYVTWTKKSIQQRFQDLDKNPTFFIFDHKTPIGVMNYRFNFPLLIKDTEKTAWMGITIGNKNYWRQGVGSKALKFLEKQAFLDGAKRIELGVFEFNTAAQKFYEMNGYARIGSVPRFVYYRDKMWADIRMEKILLG